MFRRKTQASLTNKDDPSQTAKKLILNQKYNLNDSCQSSPDQECRKSVSSSTQPHFFRKTFGFELHDFLSPERFVRLMCRPCDPASLGAIRILFGFLMVLDAFEERSTAIAYIIFSEDSDCIFPLFSFLRPLPQMWMAILGFLMLTGATGIMLGLKMSLSSSVYVVIYWYLYLMDKTVWNNHSYLFGILAFLLAVTDSNRSASIDGWLNPKIKNTHIPLWNYTLIRAQIFIVYFIAGLKKCDKDWVSGYSVGHLAKEKAFEPFRIFLTEDQINLYIVHIGGLLIDLSLGFILFFDKTRIFGLILSTSFNTINATIFRIGMFPYTMVCTQLIFCDMDWPRKVYRVLTPFRGHADACATPCQPSAHCIYPRDYNKSKISGTSDTKDDDIDSSLPTSSTWKHKLASMFTVTFIVWQIFLPYSHGITKGYNTWTEGLYGYSWDMMIHSWSGHHVRVTYHDQTTGQTGYLDPEAWGGFRRRWYSHGDMVKQYSHCVADNLRTYNLNNVSVYFDIWLSLNDRFRQRFIDPRVDIVQAEWHPFVSPTWLLPLLVDLSDWRTKLYEIESSFENDTYTNIVFLADFPGLWLENYVQPDFDNTTLTVLAGTVVVEFVDEGKNVTLASNQSVKITPAAFHKVHTVSETPSCYMYVYVNSTRQAFMKSYLQFEEDYNRSSSYNETLRKYTQDPNLPHYQQMLAEKKAVDTDAQRTSLEILHSFFRSKYRRYKMSLLMNIELLNIFATNGSLYNETNETRQVDATDQKLNATSKELDATHNESDARRDQSDARSDKSDARSDESDARSDGSDAKSDESYTRIDGSDARSDRSDARSDESDARSDGSDARSDKSDARSDGSDARSDGSDARSDGSNARSDKSDARSDESDARSDGSDARSDGSDARSDGSDARVEDYVGSKRD